MDRAGKAEAIDTLKGVFADSGSVVVARYTGLTVAEMTQFRGKLREQGALAKVVKNRLVKKALDGKGGDDAANMFVDQTVIAYSSDPVAAAKGAADYAKENDKLVIIGGIMDEQVLDKSGVEALAKLPSLDELRAKIIGVIQAPATKLATVAQAPASKLAAVFKAYAEKDAA
ncbi:MAG: 50S ribosomal protein L10 [Pseudomonadota bacterium]